MYACMPTLSILQATIFPEITDFCDIPSALAKPADRLVSTQYHRTPPTAVLPPALTFASRMRDCGAVDRRAILNRKTLSRNPVYPSAQVLSGEISDRSNVRDTHLSSLHSTHRLQVAYLTLVQSGTTIRLIHLDKGPFLRRLCASPNGPFT